MSILRRIAAVPMPDVTFQAIVGALPIFEWVEPASLQVEETYQRDLSDKSWKLIRRIAENWDWKSMKPPVCARTASGDLMVIDGQHTAIAAASRPDVLNIPVMIVEADAVADRATAFVRHNQDRIAMTPMQLHHAALAAGDEIALAMQEACKLAGVRILRNPAPSEACDLGDTMAVTTLRTIVEAKGVRFSARMLKILVDAKRAPIPAIEIAAVKELLTEPEWRDSIDPEGLSYLIRSRGPKEWMAHAEANVRKGQKMPSARALAIDWFKMLPKRRRAA